jgi:uncharacterized protein (TIGR03084 family)
VAVALDPVIVGLGEQQRELADLLASLDERAWTAPTRCSGWDVRDVVLHLAQTDDLAMASLQGTLGERLGSLASARDVGVDVDEGAGRMVDDEREGATPSAVHARWAAGAERLLAGFEACDLHRRVRWVAGEMSARTLATTRIAETWIHTGDVAEAVGVTLVPGTRLEHVARLAWRTLPYAFAKAGRTLAGGVELDLTGPDGARWHFVPDEPVVTVVRGDGVELCLVAARRVDPDATSLRAEGPDARGVLELVRTYA